MLFSKCTATTLIVFLNLQSTMPLVSSSFFLYQVLRQKLHRSFKNIKIVSNRMIFDEDGHLVSFKGILLTAMFFCVFVFARGREGGWKYFTLTIHIRYFSFQNPSCELFEWLNPSPGQDLRQES